MKSMILWQIFKLFNWLIYKICFYPEYKIHANELFSLIADIKYWQIIPDLFKNIFYEKLKWYETRTGISCYPVSC